MLCPGSMTTPVVGFRLDCGPTALPDVGSGDVVGVGVGDGEGTGAGAGTATDPDPLFPSIVALIVAVPAATAVTTPPADTDAIPVLLDVHVTVRPVSVPPVESLAVAAKVPVPPAVSDRLDGLTDTVATGTRFTTTDTAALLPFAVAVMDAEPAPTALMVALLLDDEGVTFATDELLVAHVNVAPEITLPVESLRTAVTCALCPVRSDSNAGFTDGTPAPTGTTLAAAEPFTPFTVAITVVEPKAAPFTRPVDDTVATALFALLHVTVYPLTGLPEESSGVAATCAVAPIPSDTVAGDMSSELTGSGVTVIFA